VNRKPVKFLLIAVTFTFLSCAGLVVYVTGVIDYIPRLRASAVSPDGSITVKVYQKRLQSGPLFARMGAVAKVYDRGGHVVYENVIFHDDDWDNTVGQAFNEIAFVGDEIRIGPGFYARSQIYVIRTSDLKIQK
jgi:hypothetical protein